MNARQRRQYWRIFGRYVAANDPTPRDLTMHGYYVYDCAMDHATRAMRKKNRSAR